jgi:hypothetical protein
MHRYSCCGAATALEDALQNVGGLDDVVKQLEVLGIWNTIWIDGLWAGI